MEREALLARVGELETELSPLEPGQRRDFADPDRRWRCALGGFGHVEGAGMWTVDEEAALALRLAPEAGAAPALRFELNVFLHMRRPSQRGEALVNGRPRASWAFDGQGTHMEWAEIQLRPGDVGPEGLVWILLRIDDPVSPRSLKASFDDRRLGVMLRAVELRASPEAHVVAQV